MGVAARLSGVPARPVPGRTRAGRRAQAARLPAPASILSKQPGGASSQKEGVIKTALETQFEALDLGDVKVETGQRVDHGKGAGDVGVLVAVGDVRPAVDRA